MNDSTNYNEDRKNRWEKRLERKMEHYKNGHVWTGIFLLAIGGLALARSFGVAMPHWLFTWPVLLIAIGLFIGFKKGFSDGGWFVPIIIGGAFLTNDLLNGELRRHIWPVILIVLGVFFIIRSRSRNRFDWHCKSPKDKNMNTASITASGTTSEQNFSQDDFIDTTSIFGGTEKSVLSKNFKGGSIVNIFGGSEINMTQADMTDTAVIDVTCIFGGATLIVPANWAVKSEAATIFGGISDKRSVAGFSEGSARNLVIKGTVIFGGLEIKSY